MSTSNDITPLAPGSVIGIIGGGQLGRMSAMAAAELGYRVHIFTPETDSPAAQVCARTTVAAYDDEAALEAFARDVDVVTLEFENVPTAMLKRLAAQAPVRPHWKCLEICQNRMKEKAFANELGIETAPWIAVWDVPGLSRAMEEIGGPTILKSTLMGYDGKGQVRIPPGADPMRAWSELNCDVGVLEGLVDFDMEISVITARGPDGAMVSFEPVENRHKDGILDITVAPATLATALADEARVIAHKLAESIDLVGLLAVEMFITHDGHILVNEMAPRPHNSGHWTQDGCATSQFEQFIRAVCGLPLGAVERHTNITMTNLIGTDVEAWAALLADPHNKIHLYGKNEVRAGRKMGHVNRLCSSQF